MIAISKIIRSRRRTITLEICRDATLEIRAPHHTSDEEIRQLVSAKSDWINKKIVQQSKRFLPRKEFVPGESFLYLGNYYKLEAVDNVRVTVSFDSAFLLDRNFLSNARNELIRWYKEQAALKIQERVELYSAISGLKYGRINITDARGRWGSCSGNDTLNFCWRLIMAPLKVIDYVVAHEIAHLNIRNHSQRFWNKVAVLFPGYKDCRKWLKQNGRLLSV